MALTRRANLVERMKAEADRVDPRVSATCFEILYGLKSDTQIESAVHAMTRFLPIYERLRMESSTVRQALNDPQSWLQQRGLTSPLQHEPAPFAESAFSMAFEGLLNACAFRDVPYTLTAGCTYAIRMAVDARAYAVWLADEPSLSEAPFDEVRWRDTPNPVTNVAWAAVTRREWRIVADWFSRPQVREAHDRTTVAEVAAELKKWIDHEETIVSPRRDCQKDVPKPINWPAVDARVETRVALGDPAPLEQILTEELEREQQS
jgi:hypothetical protein